MKKNVYKNNTKTLKKAFYFIGKHKYFLPLSIILALLSVALNLYIPNLLEPSKSNWIFLLAEELEVTI